MPGTPPSLPLVLCLSLLAGCSAPANDPSPSRLPHVVSTSSSSKTATAGQQLTFDVVAMDPQGSGLTFDWSANMGTLGSATSDATTSHISWTAPPCSKAGMTATITITVTNDSHLTDTQHFTVPGLPECGPEDSALRIVSSSRSSESATPGQQLIFEVQVDDPQGGALTYEWSSSAGMLSMREDTRSSSSTTWTAPGCASPQNAPVVSFFVGSSSRHTAHLDFTVPGLPDCTSKWSEGSHTSLHHPESTADAVLMKSGRVLLLGYAGVPNAGEEDPGTYAEVYDPNTGSWSPTVFKVGPYDRGALSFVSHPVALSNGKVLAIPESSLSGSKPLLYDPDTNTWDDTGALVLNHKVAPTATLLADGRVLVAGGGAGDERLKNAEVYDPATGTWSATGSMSMGRALHASTLLADGRVLLTGGSIHQQGLATAEVYDPVTGTWSATGDMHWAREGHTATLMPNGKVLVTGGCVNGDGSSPEGAAPKEEEYDPTTGTWSPTSPMLYSRRGHEAVLLSDGKVMVIGGTSNASYNVSIQTTELYDPATRAWSTTDELPKPNFYGTATRLVTGQVLLAGGDTLNGLKETNNNSFLYTP